MLLLFKIRYILCLEKAERTKKQEKRTLHAKIYSLDKKIELPIEAPAFHITNAPALTAVIGFYILAPTNCLH